MGFVSFLKLGLKCFFDFLAWPLFALVCPLYASVQAIESNSNSDMRNLVAYWIVFSLISLFELAFVKLIEWLPFWPYMKLMAICWLGLPHFNGACYVYKCLIRPCLSANPQGVIRQFVKHKEDVSLNAESFLAVAEMYVKENGSEALEKLIDRKSNHTMPNIDVEEIKAITNTVAKETVETKEMAAAIQSKFKEPNVANKDVKTVEPKEKIPAASTQWSKFKEFAVAKENAKAKELNKKNSTTAAEQVKCVEEPNLSQTEKRTVTSIKIEEKTVIEDVRENEVEEVPAVAAGGGENKVEERPASENVQKEWTCAVCQVTTTCEENLKSHLQGRRHKSTCAELKAIKQAIKLANKNKGCLSSTANQEPQKPIAGDWINQNKSKKQVDMAQVNRIIEQCKQKEVKNTTGYGVNKSKLWCFICNVKCPGEVHMASHLKGKKHLSQVQHIVDSLGGGD
ncbi:hypothetical protein ACSBR1_019361 [Camellia fascicularis]